MTRKTWAVCAVALAMAGAAISTVRADFLIENLNPFGSSGLTAGSTYGYLFTVGESDLLVTRVGVYDFLSDGLANAHFISLWTGDGVFLGDGLVGSGDSGPNVNGFVYADLSGSILLTAGESYVIGAFYPTTEDSLTNSNQSTFTVNPAIGGLQGRHSSTTGSPSFPVFDLAVVPFGPNLEFTVVPEPAHLGVVGLAGIGLLLLYRRRQIRTKKTTPSLP